jgi:hypothetical protein
LAISTLFVVPIKEQLEELAVGCFELVVAQLEPIVEPGIHTTIPKEVVALERKHSK